MSKLFFQKAACGLFVCKNDPYSTILEANDTFYKMIGYTKEEMQDYYENRFSAIVMDDLTEIIKKELNIKNSTGVLDYEYRVEHKLGHTIWIHEVATYDSDLDVFNVAIMDITYKENALEQARQAATYDKTTGVLSRCALERRIKNSINSNKLKQPQTLFLVDLDNFKLVNDEMGHQVGDEVLATVGDKLNDIFKNDFIVGRLGGDEFMIFSNKMYSVSDIEDKLKEVQVTLRLEIGTILVSASMGICFNPTGNQSFDSMYNYADKSLYQTKSEHKGRYKIVIK